MSSVKTFIKPAQKACTKILKCTQDKHKFYCDLLYSYNGIKRMWICQNFQDITDSVEYINDRNAAHDTESFDFSTLYTNFNHDYLIDNINWCFDKAFNNHDRKIITFSYLGSKSTYFTATRKNRYFNFDIDEAKSLHTWLVNNTFFKCDNLVLKQCIGIPIGADQAPYQANLGLYKDEFIFIEKLCRDKDFATARTFNHTHRYQDDVNPKNNFNNFNKYKDTIYSPGLTINKENIGQTSTSILEIDMVIDPDSKQFHTSLYDKRTNFGFPIVKYTTSTSNVHTKVVYNIFITQVIRYSRVCNRLPPFLYALKTLYKTMIGKGCKSHILQKKLFKLLKNKNILKRYNISHNFQQLHNILMPYLKE